MCTIVLLRGVVPGIPLVVAANRDEFYARPTEPPSRAGGDPAVVCGRDGEKGGTWMGATARGFFVGVTNQRTWHPADKSLRSRGQLALELLGDGSHEAAERRLAHADAREYNAFNLVFGDARALRVAYAREGAREIEVHDVPDGVHVLPNDRLDSPEFPKAARAATRARAVAARPLGALAPALVEILADHETPAPSTVPPPPPGSPMTHDLVVCLHATCIHTPVYGTRSATLLALAEGRVLSYQYADGPPCTTPFVERVGLFTP